MANRKRENEEENIESRDGKGRRDQASLGAILPSDEMLSMGVLHLNDGQLPKLVIIDLDKTGSILLAVASRSPIETAARGILGALGIIDISVAWRFIVEARLSTPAISWLQLKYRTERWCSLTTTFNDSKANIKTLQKLGVCCIKVSQDTGLTFDAVRSGLERYRKLCLSRSKMREWFHPPTDQTGEKTSGAIES